MTHSINFFSLKACIESLLTNLSFSIYLTLHKLKVTLGYLYLDHILMNIEYVVKHELYIIVHETVFCFSPDEKENGSLSIKCD